VILLREAGVSEPFEAIGRSRTFAPGDRKHDPFGVARSIRGQGDVGSPEGHVVGESMRWKLRSEPGENLLCFGLFLLFRETDTQRVEHVGNLRRLGIISEERLPRHDGSLALPGLPRRLGGKGRGLGRLRMPGSG
jgi:hypothetical protein